jgi:DNA-binding transcriptional MerR regulator
MALSETRPPESASRPRKALTIGAVCKILQSEFDDISISKIRYLEDQKLLTPRRTPGGYRLYSQADVERLRTILRLQRDEFLPLRVIRQELAAGGEIDLGGGDGDRRTSGGSVRRAILVNTSRAYLTLDQLIEETGAREELVSELENYGIVQPEKREGRIVYDETDREVVKAANELSRFGVGARNMRVFRTSADRESNLLEAVLGSSLRSRNPDRRKEALESLESLAATVSHLKHLLLVRDLRRLAGN